MYVVDALQYSNPSREIFEFWRAGGVSAVHATVAIWEDAVATLREIGKWHVRFREHDDLIGSARSSEEIREVADSGRTAVFLGFQNSSPFQDDLDLVPAFHEAGVRIAQLTYNTQNSAGGGCWESSDVGLSKTYGRNLVREMNATGMLVDVSHSNERTCLGAIEASEKPVALTHANPLEYVGDSVELHFRNKSKDVLKAMAESGGVIGLSMYPRLAPNGADCSLDDFCDMICWTVDLVGIEHVGFGSDFYTGHDDEEIYWWRMGRWSRELLVQISGMPEFPDWFDSSAGYPKVLAGLRDRGMTDGEVMAVAGGNWLRLFEKTF